MATEIKVTNLTKSYPKGPKALQGVDLQVKKGSFFTLLGPNGAGKSTLVKILTSLIKKDSGDFIIGAISPEKQFADFQRYVGIASQDNEIDPGEKVFALLEFQGRLYGLSKKDAGLRAKELIELFGLQAEKDKKAETLSGGNKRRLHCALALVHKPKVLFLDEPTTGMDPVARSTFWDVITKLNKNEGVTIFLTTQYLEEADKHASEMALIIEGKVHYSGSVTGFKEMVHPNKNASLEDSYISYINTISQNKTINTLEEVEA